MTTYTRDEKIAMHCDSVLAEAGKKHYERMINISVKLLPEDERTTEKILKIARKVTGQHTKNEHELGKFIADNDAEYDNEFTECVKENKSNPAIETKESMAKAMAILRKKGLVGRGGEFDTSVILAKVKGTASTVLGKFTALRKTVETHKAEKEARVKKQTEEYETASKAEVDARRDIAVAIKEHDVQVARIEEQTQDMLDHATTDAQKAAIHNTQNKKLVDRRKTLDKENKERRDVIKKTANATKAAIKRIGDTEARASATTSHEGIDNKVSTEVSSTLAKNKAQRQRVHETHPSVTKIDAQIAVTGKRLEHPSVTAIPQLGRLLERKQESEQLVRALEVEQKRLDAEPHVTLEDVRKYGEMEAKAKKHVLETQKMMNTHTELNDNHILNEEKGLLGITAKNIGDSNALETLTKKSKDFTSGIGTNLAKADEVKNAAKKMASIGRKKNILIIVIIMIILFIITLGFIFFLIGGIWAITIIMRDNKHIHGTSRLAMCMYAFSANWLYVIFYSIKHGCRVATGH